MNVWPENNSRALAALLRWVLFVLFVGHFVGCSTVKPPKPPAATVTMPSGAQLEQTGAAEVPATVTTATEIRSVPLPAGTALVFDEKAGTVTVKLSRDSNLTETITSERAEAPRAFTPSAPPTAAQLAQADGVRWFYAAALLGVVAAGLLVWRGHILAAVLVGAGSAALPILARFYSSAVALPLAAGLVCAGVAVFAAWHILNRRHALSAGDAKS